MGSVLYACFARIETPPGVKSTWKVRKILTPPFFGRTNGANIPGSSPSPGQERRWHVERYHLRSETPRFAGSGSGASEYVRNVHRDPKCPRHSVLAAYCGHTSVRLKASSPLPSTLPAHAVIRAGDLMAIVGSSSRLLLCAGSLVGWDSYGSVRDSCEFPKNTFLVCWHWFTCIGYFFVVTRWNLVVRL